MAGLLLQPLTVVKALQKLERINEANKQRLAFTILNKKEKCGKPPNFAPLWCT
jgi:hypothetical protein